MGDLDALRSRAIAVKLVVLRRRTRGLGDKRPLPDPSVAKTKKTINAVPVRVANGFNKHTWLRVCITATSPPGHVFRIC